MLRIKNRRANVPNGYLYVQRESGWDASKVIPHTISDFNAVVQAIRSHRMANPALKLNTSLPAIEAELEAVTVARLQAMPGADIYLQDVGGASPTASFQPAPQQTLAKLAHVVGAVQTAKDVLFDWEESGQPPVAQGLANKRAETCVACSQNGRGGLSRYFTVPAAALIQSRLEKLHAMKMETPNDGQLGVCDACLCVNRLKVWTPIEFIKQHTTPEIMAKLDKNCWVRSEAA
jgi:hypothetical protein